MKVHDAQMLKITQTRTHIEMEIKISDIAELFNEDPDNSNGFGPMAKIKRGRNKDFAAYIIEHIMEFQDNESDTPLWGRMFRSAFDEILEGDEEFCSYHFTD